MFSPIHHTFAPLGDLSQCLLAFALTLQPWKYKRGAAVKRLERALAEKFECEAYTFGSGREALLALLKALKVRPGEEVIVQGYTCVVVPNAIHASGALPKFADIAEDTLNMDPASVEALMTPRTRAVICQHTFGIPADTTRLRALCDRYLPGRQAGGAVLIEDCAHSIPDQNQSMGYSGDFVILSFGRDKAISGISGGAVLSRDPATTMELRKIQGTAVDHSMWTICRLLQYPLFYAVARPLYGLWIGKALLKALRSLRLLIPILDVQEKEGSMSPVLHRIPNACASLALAQLRSLRKINDHRRMLTRFYFEEARKRGWRFPGAILPYSLLQKFPLFFPGAEQLRRALKAENIHLNDGWTGCVICPENIDLGKTEYVPGTDPAAEDVCVRILSLPTHPKTSLRQARRLVEAIQQQIDN
ncbi:DegT/DnrJ/EryC1/StrS aminotransferase family protein [Candidatus Peregrinibacteria bacterium]|nr:DegT/DnrJ/EryC1/StrS aminotransferase family protein [Candidatus Peregrinibacteria bacterium]